jgi:hypothetical protein
LIGGRGEKMSAILPRMLLGADQPQPGFVHQRRRLECMASGFLGRSLRRKFAKLLINEPQQLLAGLRVALPGAVQSAGDIAHESRG